MARKLHRCTRWPNGGSGVEPLQIQHTRQRRPQNCSEQRLPDAFCFLESLDMRATDLAGEDA
jgi:hypothetical protein